MDKLSVSLLQQCSVPAYWQQVRLFTICREHLQEEQQSCFGGFNEESRQTVIYSFYKQVPKQPQQPGALSSAWSHIRLWDGALFFNQHLVSSVGH